MKRFRILFYRPDIDGQFVDNAISAWTSFWNIVGHPTDAKIIWLLRCSHCEIWKPDEQGNFASTRPGFLGTCYTATRGISGGDNKVKENGSVKRLASEILTTPRRWFYFEFEICDESFKAMVDWMDLQVEKNERYDQWDIFKFFLPIRKQNPDDNQKICSGFCWIAVFIATIQEFVYCNKMNITGSEKQLFTLINKRTKKNLPSPLLLAYWIYKMGAKALNLETIMEITK